MVDDIYVTQSKIKKAIILSKSRANIYCRDGECRSYRYDPDKLAALVVLDMELYGPCDLREQLGLLHAYVPDFSVENAFNHAVRMQIDRDGNKFYLPDRFEMVSRRKIILNINQQRAANIVEVSRRTWQVYEREGSKTRGRIWKLFKISTTAPG